METRNCQNCKQDFTIEPDDFSFYEKIKVPPPTFCPDCRMIRRMTWRNERSLFKRKCDKTGKDIITMFHPDAPVKVYERDVWWSDDWDPTAYGKDYDFSKPFFEQFNELLQTVPLASLGNTNTVNSPYTNHTADARNCYLIFGGFSNQSVYYSEGTVEAKETLDTYKCVKIERCYGDVLCGGIYNTHFSFNTDESLNSWFLEHCVNVQDSIGCVNLRHKSNHIFNQPYSREQYLEKKKEFDFGSWKFLEDFRKQYREFSLKFPRRYANNIKCTNCTGDNMINCQNVKNSFDAYDDVRDSKYVQHIVTMKDGYDGYGLGANSSLMYEGVDSGIDASNQLFAVLAHSNLNTNYIYMCYSANNLFGCIGIRNRSYCILNKQYTKEEYEALVPKIIEHMKNMPYVNDRGISYSYGEFFPTEFSPFAYNETIAQEYFPKTKAQIIEGGYVYREHPDRNYQITLKSEDLPDHINDVEDSITGEVILCPNEGNETTQCTYAYRITSEELKFLKQHTIALPRYCPNCRYHKRLIQRNPFKLWHRSCMKEGCPNEFETSYAPDRPEIVYCEKCYQQEVY